MALKSTEAKEKENILSRGFRSLFSIISMVQDTKIAVLQYVLYASLSKTENWVGIRLNLPCHSLPGLERNGHVVTYSYYSLVLPTYCKYLRDRNVFLIRRFSDVRDVFQEA